MCIIGLFGGAPRQSPRNFRGPPWVLPRATVEIRGFPRQVPRLMALSRKMPRLWPRHVPRFCPWQNASYPPWQPTDCVNGGSAKATVMTCCRPLPFFSLFFFFLFAPYLVICYFSPHRPDAGIFFLLFALFLSVKHSSIFFVLFCPCNTAGRRYVYLLRVVLPVQQVFAPLQNVWCPSGNCSLVSFPFRSCITFFRTPTCRWFCFVFKLFFLFFFSLLFPFLSFFSWSGSFCCVLEPGTLALYLFYIDELRLFGLLCFTVVCDHRICISLDYRLKQHGLWVY